MAKHPAWLVAREMANRLSDMTSVSAMAATMNFRRLAGMAKNSDKFYVAVSPEDVIRSVASRRVRVGSVQFTITVRVAKHTGSEQVNDLTAEEAFFDMVQEISDKVLGLATGSPEGTDINLGAPWGIVQWPSESQEVPADEDLSALSIRDRTIQFSFAVTRQGV